MPGIFYRPLDRRSFLRTAALSAAALSVLPALRAAESAPAGSVRLALISDTHVDADAAMEVRKFKPGENLKRIIPEILETKPAAVIHNGDIARLLGEVADYQTVKSLLEELARNAPIFLGLGNHDDRENFGKVFTESAKSGQKVKDKHVLVVEQEPVRFVMLDSLLFPNKTPGFLGKAQRDWLEQYLRTSDSKPVVLFVHHTLGEQDGELLDADRLFEVVGGHSKVKAIIYGHSHQYSFKRRDGIHLINLPAVGYPFNEQEPIGWVDSFFSADGATFELRAFGSNTAQNRQKTSLSWRS
jgi:Icc protein